MELHKLKLSKIKTKEIRQSILKISPNDTKFKWGEFTGIIDHDFIWHIPKTVTRETKLLTLQWKILHKIYPTNILLQRMNLTQKNASLVEF